LLGALFFIGLSLLGICWISWICRLFHLMKFGNTFGHIQNMFISLPLLSWDSCCYTWVIDHLVLCTGQWSSAQFLKAFFLCFNWYNF
jgi:hypothetical protein